MSFSADSYDSDASFGLAGAEDPPGQVQNCYDRPSTADMNSTSFKPRSNEDDGSAASGSGGDDSDEEPTAVAAPIEPRGKTFSPPKGVGDNNTSSSEEDDGDLKPSNSTNAAAANATAAPAANPNPSPPRGKELRRILKGGGDSSSDDEPLVNMRSKDQSKAKNGSRKKSAAASTKSAAISPNKKTSSKAASAARKRKAPPSNDSDSDSGDDCVATIINGDGDAEGVTAVAMNIKSNKKMKTNDGTAKKKKTTTTTTKKTAKKGAKKPGPKRAKKSSSVFGMPEVSAETADAAQAARIALQGTVTCLPQKITDSHTIRSFGTIKPEYDVDAMDALYSCPHALYPVGFSCDRFEFSPVHGRIIKMRCDILDGRSLRERREEMKKDGQRSGDPMLVDEKAPVGSEKDVISGNDVDNLGDGPVFRVTWGEGVEEDKILEPSCPFDPYLASAHLGGDVDAVAVPLSSKKGKRFGLPEVGMRVSVRFDKGKMYGGAITKVEPMQKKNKKAICNITIQYDDGVTEVAAFPDPDVVVAYQGCPPVETADGFVTEMNGKLVRSVLAKTPLEAWGKTLLSLGLIDEPMYGAALQQLQISREEGFKEVREKLDAVNKKRRDDRAKEKQRRSNRRSVEGDGEKDQDTDDESAVTDKTGPDKDDKREDPSAEEVELRVRLAEVQNKLEAAKKRSKAASLNLANARIATISPFAANPFLCRDESTALEVSWLTAAIKKERSKMGNTGNKRKIVNPATLMDKSDTFFVPEIEHLVEGLPGTEFAPFYVFHANRSASGNSTWIHEAKIRHQKQQQRKAEKALKVKTQAAARAKVDQQKVLKRKLKQEEAADKRRLKEEEEDQRKKKRVEKRLSQLNLQMDDRMFKESCMMREKNIMNFVRGLNKEFARRRKAAELAVGNKIERSLASSPPFRSSSILAPFGEMLPPLSRTYDGEVVRIWDFLHSFSSVFPVSSMPTSLLSLNSLQDAIDCLKTNARDQQKRSSAVELFEGIAIGLCKVISPSLTKILSSSTPNFDIIGANGTEGGPQDEADVSCLPVTEYSWQEIARMAIINDVLTDLGYSKQDSANLVKGYRSGGHPNSKEAKRWKKIEESPVIMMYHRLEHEDDSLSQLRSSVVRTSISTPCTPSSVPSDWRFFLHNVKSRSSNSPRFIKNNVTKALAALKKASSVVEGADSYVADLERCLAIVEGSGHGNNSAPELHKAKQIAVGVLDSTRETFKDNVEVSQQHQIQLFTNQTSVTHEPARQKMGFQKLYQMSKDQFKALEQAKEEYMAAALRLKEELERKENDDEEEDEEDDDAEGNAQGDKADKEPLSEPKEANDESQPSGLEGEKNPETATSSDKPSGTTAKTDEADNHQEADASSDDPNDPSTAVDGIDITGHPTASEKDAHLPSERAEGFPDGWVVRRVPRLNPNDKRTDRNWYSPKLGLKFRSRADAQRFLEKVDSANGDEAAAIVEYHGKKTEKAGSEAANKPPSKATSKAASKVAPDDGNDDANKAEYDFCEDIPLAPDLIRRCMAVIRTLCATNSADPFIYPVDPQLYPGYYETVMNPTSLYDVGKFLQETGNKFSSKHDDPEVEEVVALVGTKVRTIVQNSVCVNSSNNIVNSAEEMLRIFERLFFDWVLAPSAERPELENLDDDRCIYHHESDLNSMVLLCDACEGKYNMARLRPALDHVPSGDWYCPRCVSGRSWLTADPRLGRKVQNGSFSGTVQSCKFLFTEDGKSSILYCIKAANSGRIEYWGIEDVDELILGDPVEPVRCLQALAESPGYGFGRDSGIVGGAVPLAINPLIVDKAAQAALSSGVFQDTVSACVSLSSPPEDFTAEEWITLLMLLVTKCSQSDDLQELSSNLENKEASRLSSDLMTFWRARAAKNIVPNLSDDDSVSSEDESIGAPPSAPSDIPSVIEDKLKKDEPPMRKDEQPTDVVMKSSGEEVSVEDHPANMEISFQSSNEAPEEASSSAAGKASDQPSKEAEGAVMSEEDVLRKKLEASFLAKTRRERKREEALMGFYVSNRLKSTAASFEEDFLSTIVKSTLCSQEQGLDLSAVRCRESCHYCGLSDVALGAPLCRTPNEKEWREAFPHAVHDRTTYMIAEFPEKSSEDNPFNLESRKLPPENTVVEKRTKFVSVRVRVGGELVSSKNRFSNKNFDSAMQQFLPKNLIGFQSELKFRYESNLSVLSGSIPAHEVCAMGAHRSRKENLLAERRTFHRANMTRDASLVCGKSIPIGTDPFGRSYWVFSAEPTSLFVCTVDAKSGAGQQWHRFHEPEEIASIMVCLGGKDLLCETMKEVFPEAAKVVKDRSWSTLLLGRSLHRKSDSAKGLPPSEEPEMVAEEKADYGAPFVEDEDVLVESEKGKFLWDAVIVDVSKDPETEKVDGYLVHYKNWSSRFDQWVTPDRVVEPNKINEDVQEEVLQEFSAANDATPPMLEGMFAFKFLNAKKRARSTPVSKTELFESAFTRPSASHDEKLLGLLKGAILLIEAALPRGSVGSSANGSWDPQAAAIWRNLVKDASGPESIMKCVLLLEDAVSPDWMHSQATQLYASLPKQWRAMGNASLPAVALRVSILDRCLKYQLKKKKHDSLA